MIILVRYIKIIENVPADMDLNIGNTDDIADLILNAPISDKEIVDSVKELNINKASSCNLMAEQFIHDIDMVLPFVNIFFNRLFDKEEFPTAWGNQQ